MIPLLFQGEPAIIIGTGPSLGPMVDEVRALAGRARLFGMNQTYLDFTLDVFHACDPKWWQHYGDEVRSAIPQVPCWHWDRTVCERYGLDYIEGRWGEGLSTDPAYIHLGHSSSWQTLNIASLMGCSPLVLVGFDMTYRPGEPRHYFNLPEEDPGEYPHPLRKFSLFDKPNGTGLLRDYRQIAEQAIRGEIAPVINCSPGSAMTWFPMKRLAEVFP